MKKRQETSLPNQQDYARGPIWEDGEGDNSRMSNIIILVLAGIRTDLLALEMETPQDQSHILEGNVLRLTSE